MRTATLSFTITTIYKRYTDVLVILSRKAEGGLEYNLEGPRRDRGGPKNSAKKHEIDLGFEPLVGNVSTLLGMYSA